MYYHYISIFLLKVIIISATALSLACSPSQQPEHDIPTSTQTDQANPAITATEQAPHLQNNGPEDESGSTAPPHSTMHAADSAPFAIHTPEMWEVKIARMIADGNIADAEAELRKLKREYPDYNINPSLLENMNKHHE
jgi:hypothetical protein